MPALRSIRGEHDSDRYQHHRTNDAVAVRVISLHHAASPFQMLINHNPLFLRNSIQDIGAIP